MNFVFNNFNNVANSQQVEDFCKSYYTKMSEYGVHEALNLFDKGAICTVDNIIMKTPYELLLSYAKSNVKRIKYESITSTWQTIGDSVLLSSLGKMTPISYNDISCPSLHFSESFIIKPSGTGLLITNYIMKTIN